MKILSWNIQGGKIPKHKLNSYTSKTNTIRTCFVIETLTNAANSRKILKALHFHNTLIIDPVNHSSGIWVCWNNNNINMLNHDTYSGLVELQILYNPNNSIYSIFGTYVLAQSSEKNAFWTFLNNFLTNANHPWLLLGDFNEILLHQDKLGWAPIRPHHLQHLPALLTTHSAIDIPSTQPTYSWKGLANNPPPSMSISIELLHIKTSSLN